jgi:hypothetical protein
MRKVAKLTEVNNNGKKKPSRKRKVENKRHTVIQRKNESETGD